MSAHPMVSSSSSTEQFADSFEIACVKYRLKGEKTCNNWYGSCGPVVH